MRFGRFRLLAGIIAAAAVVLAAWKLLFPPPPHLGPLAWGRNRWERHAHGVRTSYNPDKDLSDTELTLVPGDARWLDFVYWTISNKIAEHQVEAYGGTNWAGPKGGVIFHWAPGSHWERDTLASFGFTIGHIIGEHRLTDTMFPDFFEKYGGVYGVNVKDRLAEIDPKSAKPWVDFLEYGGAGESPYYRYLFHREAVVDPVARRIYLLAGQGVAFSYTFERYYHEVREVLTDARCVDFFVMYDRFGPGFAARGNWAHQNPPPEALRRTGYVIGDEARPGVAEAVRYNPSPPAVPVPKDLPEADAMERGEKVYLAQCAVCHGIEGDGAGFLAAGFDVKPRDFRQARYKFRSTQTGQLPTIADIERTIRVGVPGTTMPAWGQFLTDEQIHDVARYLVVFSERFVEAWKAREQPDALAIGSQPGDLTALASRGAAVWKENQCALCHGEGGFGNGPSAATLVDSWDQPIRPANLTYKWTFKNGHEPGDIYRTIAGGLNGTPMPSYNLKPEDAWALVANILARSPAT
ncbi:MAG TPA: c-type cytochrome, partial [Planctomycetota bacterium]|nr:c-type cytochrome [Planctomycetota bacterium]